MVWRLAEMSLDLRLAAESDIRVGGTFALRAPF